MKRSIYPLTFLGLALAWTITGCNTSGPGNKRTRKDTVAKQVERWNKTIPGNFSEQREVFLDSTALNAFFATYPDTRKYEKEMRQFYSNRKYAYAWFDSKGLIEQAENLNNRIQNIQSEGVTDTVSFHLQLDTLMHNAGDPETGAVKADVNTELLLTAGYFAFSKIVWEGLDENISKSNDWLIPRKKISYEEYLQTLLKQPKDSFLADAPVYKQYEGLKQQLQQYRNMIGKVDWSTITLDKKAYKPGDSSAALLQIKKRLFALGDWKGDTLSGRYGDDFKPAVQQFQIRHGLGDDGVIGGGMVRALNVPLTARIEQIVVNMERSRWVPVQLNTDHLIVNIPEFKLHVYEKDKLAWSCNVVVGQAVHKTVVFSGDLKYVVFSPYWNVPYSIAKNEVLPGMRRNKSYLSRHNMEVLGYNGAVPVVRQKPGGANSLGLVKFLFPNSHSIYLHDSPSKGLFNRDSRAFSHGCVRVSEPKHLAMWLLRNEPSWTEARIDSAMNAGKEKTVTLKETVPVFIGYFTAFVDDNGLMNFREDIYKRDERLSAMVLKQDSVKK
jgi:murein L,D-transpeptidase YcbB/YkuD